MILDQANELRELVRNFGREDGANPCRRPGTILVIGGKGGVGTTTLAANLAVALAQLHGRTTLAEAASPGGSISLLCANKDIVALRELQIIPLTFLCDNCSEDLLISEEQLFEKIIRQGKQSKIIVIDGGNHPNRMWHGMASVSEMVLVTTTADPAAIVGSHAVIKMLRKTTKGEKIYTLVNQIHRASAAEEVHKRLHRACRRFLGINLHHAGYVAHDPAVNAAARTKQPFMLSAPTGRASRQVRALAENVVKKISTTLNKEDKLGAKKARAA
jgi:flagellar biosynthesis protein FlhG